MPILPNDAALALRRAKFVVTKDDVGEYDKLNTDVMKRALAHSLMKVGCFSLSSLIELFLRLVVLRIVIVFLRRA